MATTNIAGGYFDLGLPQLPQSDDPRNEPDLRSLYFAVQNLAKQVAQGGGYFPPAASGQTTGNAANTIGTALRRLYVVASVAITYGELVNLWDDTGTLKGQLADATTVGTEAHGICNTQGTCAIGDIIEVVLPGAYITSVGSLTRGVTYYTSTTPGSMQNTRPAVSGNFVQAVGVAISSDELFFNLSYQTEVVP